MLKPKIFLNGQDRTDEIKTCVQKDKFFEIKFHNNPKTYTYHKNKVFIKKPTNSEIVADLALGYFKKLIAMIYENTTNLENKQIFEILLSNFNEIDEFNPQSTAFKIISGEFNPNLNDQNELIFPFGFNLSQSNAIKNAFNSEISTIEGPPGTGKTQTILNIITNALLQNKSVAVVSNNNSATKNVFEKLEKYGLEFLVAQLGNKANKTEFLNIQKTLPNLNEFKLKKQEFEKIYSNLQNLQKNLLEKLNLKNELSKLKQKLFEIEIEQKHFMDFAKNLEIKENIKEIKNLKISQEYLNLSTLLENFDEKKLNFISEFIKEKLEFFGFKFKTILFKKLLKKYPKQKLITWFESKFYELEIKNLKEKINKINTQLINFDFENKMKEYCTFAMKILKSNLAQIYSNHKRKFYQANNLRLNSQDFIKDYPVVLSTTHSLRNCLNSDFLYDFIVIDESSQVDICTGILSLNQAKNAVIVGDLKQLPNIVPNDIAKFTDKIFLEFNLPNAFDYKQNCLLSFVSNLLPNSPKVLLKEHYRCNAQIIEFCNQKFYNGELIVLSQNHNKMPLTIYKTPQGNHAKNHINQRQIDIIRDEIIPNENLNKFDESIGIITPYRNQAKALQDEFKNTKIKAATVDSFQGRENKIIILSTVDNEIGEFADNPNRLNVAISRAIQKLIVIINSNKISKDKNINDLINYIKYNNLDIKDSTTFSVFDYLYKCNQKARENFLKNKKKISKFDSENLMYMLICDILKNELKALNLSVVSHVPLYKIIKDFSNLNDNETKFITNGLSHCDFLIYKNIDKSPILGIEVDGSSFHDQNSKQAKRDEIKNQIFKKCGLNLVRFSTKGSNEKNKLINAIQINL